MDLPYQFQEIDQHLCRTPFPNTPAYLSSEPPKKRKNPLTRNAEIDARDNEQFEEWLSMDVIETFDILCDKIEDYVSDNSPDWIVTTTADVICLFITDINDVPRISSAVKIYKDLRVEAFQSGLKLASASLLWVV